MPYWWGFASCCSVHCVKNCAKGLKCIVLYCAEQKELEPSEGIKANPPYPLTYACEKRCDPLPEIFLYQHLVSRLFKTEEPYHNRTLWG